jgi:hypothetical protein
MRLALALLSVLAMPARAQDPPLFSLEQYLLDFS